MKRLFLILLITLTVNVFGQGQGYINYKSFKILNGNNTTTQYARYPANAADFDAQFNTNNSHTTLTHEGIDTALKAFTFPWPDVLPRWGNDYFGWEISGYLVAQETGTYQFYITSDDKSDFFLDGVAVAWNYNGNYHSVGTIDLVAGQVYTMRTRFQEVWGGQNVYLRWKRPSQSGYNWNSDEIWSWNPDTQPDPLEYDVNFKFDDNVDASTYSVNTHYVANEQTTQNSISNSISLNAAGIVDISNQIDEELTADGTSKATTTSGNVEWVVFYGYGTTTATSVGHRILVDGREFTNTGYLPSTLTHIQLLDIYDGPVEILSTNDGSSGWQQYLLPGDLSTPLANSSYGSDVIRNGGSYYGIRAEFTFQDNTGYKEQYVVFDEPSDMQIVDDVFTVSDVYLAFKELSNNGIGLNETGNEYTYGIQYLNSDVDKNGVFNFSDTYMMMDFLNGGVLFDASTLTSVMRLIETSTYNSLSSSISGHATTAKYPLNLLGGTLVYDKDITVSWLGDVNLSHSPTPTNNLSVTGKFITQTTKTEDMVSATLSTKLKDGKVVVILKLNPLQHKIKGTQFRISFNNSLLSYEGMETTSEYNNFTTLRDTYLNFGSIITSGNGYLDNTTEYTITLKTLSDIDNILGLIAITKSEVVNEEGTQLEVIIK